jgi:SAM-dependent methyltransferase
MEIFWELFSDLPQEGPGSDDLTLKAVSLIPDLPTSPAILDIGCGPGRQTMVLAKHTGGIVTALDIHQPFLDEVARRADAAGVSERVVVRNRSMTEMDFEENSFDLVWSEGAIYIMGFRNGLESCRRFLKPGGYVAVSELSWYTDEPHPEPRKFFEEGYPVMKTIDQNCRVVEDTGYELITSFTLPDSAWFDGYYTPLEERIPGMREKYAGDKEAIEFLDSTQEEIDIFRKYSSSYGYVFYIMKASTLEE